jgi:quercetin dioxygenase-like cupin family protein
MGVKVVHYEAVPADPVPDLEGVTIRWLIAKADGAPHFAMRLFELQPGSGSPDHRHTWEHEVFVLEGEGVVRTEDGNQPLSPGVAVFVPGEVQHQFLNTGTGPLRFLCLIPHVD